MTITARGEMYLGGKIKSKKEGALSNYSDYVQFDSKSNNESIRILKNADGSLALWLGDRKLVDWLTDLSTSISEAKAAAGSA
jgi:hypothetical protein